MKFIRCLSVCLISAAGIGLSMPGAKAASLLWTFRSEHPKVVSLEFYSQARRGHVWPGRNKVYVLKDYENHSMNLSCNRGEKICYGAWVRNRKRSYWGVGPDNRHRCTRCCYICGSGDTKTIVLNP